MDLGMAGKWALVCGASKGLGLGCAQALAVEGVHLVVTARSEPALQEAAASLRAVPGAGEVRTAVGDIATEEGRRAALATAPQVDILVTNAGGPPAGDFREWSDEHWHRALSANMLAPIALIRASVDAMVARRFGRIVNITSGAVKAPIGALGLSNGARAGLTGFVAGLALQPELASCNVTINSLLPGAFETERLLSNLQGVATRSEMPLDQVVQQRRRAIPAGRFGTPQEFGKFCAFLCSAQAGYLTGQNILLDGGAYPGTF